MGTPLCSTGLFFNHSSCSFVTVAWLYISIYELIFLVAFLQNGLRCLWTVFFHLNLKFLTIQLNFWLEMYLIIFFFLSYATWLVESEFPDLGLNLGPLSSVRHRVLNIWPPGNFYNVFEFIKYNRSSNIFLLSSICNFPVSPTISSSCMKFITVQITNLLTFQIVLYRDIAILFSSWSH